MDALLYPAVAVPHPQGIPTEGPASHPQGPPPREYPYEPRVQFIPQPSSSSSSIMSSQSPKPDVYYAQQHQFHPQAQTQPSTPPSPSADHPTSSSGAGANHYPSSTGVPRLPPILQVEKQQVTTSATQLASASRRRNEAHFVCPVPGCGSTFTRRFNLRGHLRSHTEERPYVCEWPGCKKGFARQHDCKRHQALHAAKSQSNVCQGCKKTFSRLDALNRHLRSDGGADCRASNPKFATMDSDAHSNGSGQGVSREHTLQ
ncbi:hypothetical protein GALMADRAFT_249169 [Galerina marginata CBS 339.88]|uniref:C2H2-type domain-containing protein n=1 Tax=Galerina marginata (strain CBS 339.88) TaxID=685588 RepID=A0A067T5J7_GALM3|nr:hypothetical protein GALMADRAFT_249169 [Galerina marginata CBS 339.88]